MISSPIERAKHIGQDPYSTRFPRFVDHARNYVGVPCQLIFVKTEYTFKNLTNLISGVNTRQRVFT